MKRVKSVMVLYAMVLVCAWAACLQAAPGGKDRPKPQPPTLKTDLDGMVKSVDVSANRLVLTVSGKTGDVDRTIATDANTTIKVNGQTGSLSDIKAGMQAGVVFTAVDSNPPMASSIVAKGITKAPGDNPK